MKLTQEEIITALEKSIGKRGLVKMLGVNKNAVCQYQSGNRTMVGMVDLLFKLLIALQKDGELDQYLETVKNIEIVNNNR